MNCPIETHQFITTWTNNLPSDLRANYNNLWVYNADLEYFGFIPNDPMALILGTFPVPENKTSGFFYHSDVNACWKILSLITKTDLTSLDRKLKWLSIKKISISDIVCKAQRINADCTSRADRDLNVKCYNNIFQLLKVYSSIKDIFLTSGGPTTKNLSGKSAGGWLGSHLRDVTSSRLKKMSIDKGSLSVYLSPLNKSINLHFLITPAPQDNQLGRHLRDKKEVVGILNSINFLQPLTDIKEKYKAFQWAVHFSKIPDIVDSDVELELTERNIDKILMEYLR